MKSSPQNQYNMLIKSLFISSFIFLLSIAAIYSAYMVWQDTTQLAWWAALLAVMPQLIFFINLFLRPVARTSAVLGWIFVPVVLATGLLFYSGSHNLIAWASVVGIGWAGNLLYQFWFSRFGRVSNERLAVGQKLPAMSFYDTQKQLVQVNDLQGPLLLIFYRGNWCPLCVAQIKEVAEMYKALAERGIQALLISPQPEAMTQKLAKQFDVPMRFLADKDSVVAKSLGIYVANGTPAGLQVLGFDNDTVMPTVILTDAAHQIIFVDETDNYRVRPEPELFLKIYDQHVRSV